MPLQLFNTLSGKVEEFHPLEDNLVRMYACGPTVYDYGHIGNFRTFIVVDTLRRFLKQSGYKLKHVMNITDVDDKIIRNAAARRRQRPGVHQEVQAGVSRRCRRAEHPASRIPGERHRPHSGDGALHRRTCGKGICLPHGRRLLLLPNREVSRVRQALEEGLRRHERRRARGRGRIRQGQRPRLRAVEGAEAGRGAMGDRDRSRPSGLAHRVLANVDEVPRRELRHSCRRRRPHLPASRKRDRAVGGDDRQAIRARSGCMRASCWWKARRWPRARATSSPSAISS